MSTLSFKHINKIYENNVQAVFDFNLDIANEEFIVFVGPSGCGKSTTLRMVAGLENITNGELYIDNVLVNNIEPKDRNIAMVFQNYALYPHMSVYGNMAFALKLRKVPCPVYLPNEEADFIRTCNKKLISKAKSLRRKAKNMKQTSAKSTKRDSIKYALLRKDLLNFEINYKLFVENEKLNRQLKSGEIDELRMNEILISLKEKTQECLKEVEDKFIISVQYINNLDLASKNGYDLPNSEKSAQGSFISFEKIDLFKEAGKIYDRVLAEELKAKELLEKNRVIGIYDEKIKELENQIVSVKKDLCKYQRFLDKGGFTEEATKALQEGANQKQNQIEKLESQLEYYKTTEVPILRSRKLTSYEMDVEINKAAKILDLESYILRKPSALSGGQRQRVALGRCIVRNPKVFLMDEPLSNLDAKLRVQTRSEIINIHKQVHATTIYVTHDQTEAMTMADRIVVMKDGYIQQIGSPELIYSDPTNTFVAGFIGNPAMNFLEGTFDGKSVNLDLKNDDTINASIKLSKEQIELLKGYKDKEVIVGVRPEKVLLSNDSALSKNANIFDIVCNFRELLGYESVIYTTLAGQKFLVKVGSELRIKAGDSLKIGFNLDSIYLFDKETTNRIK